jgi:hypothetical protein
VVYYIKADTFDTYCTVFLRLLWDDRPCRDFFNSSWKHEKLYFDLDIEKDHVFFLINLDRGTTADGYDSHGGKGFDEGLGGRERS